MERLKTTRVSVTRQVAREVALEAIQSEKGEWSLMPIQHEWASGPNLLRLVVQSFGDVFVPKPQARRAQSGPADDVVLHLSAEPWEACEQHDDALASEVQEQADTESDEFFVGVDPDDIVMQSDVEGPYPEEEPPLAPPVEEPPEYPDGDPYEAAPDLSCEEEKKSRRGSAGGTRRKGDRVDAPRGRGLREGYFLCERV